MTELLFKAATIGSTGTLEDLIAAGANVNASTPSVHTPYETPLSCAAAYGHAHAIHILAAAGADVNHVGSDGHTSLHRALARDWVECVKALLQWGADESLVDRDGRTAAEYAALGSPCCVRVFDRAGCNQILDVLARAPAGRAWRRRGWLTMIYARCRRRITESAADCKELRPHCRRKTTACGLSSQHKAHASLKRFRLTVMRMMELEEGVFRTVASFL